MDIYTSTCFNYFRAEMLNKLLYRLQSTIKSTSRVRSIHFSPGYRSKKGDNTLGHARTTYVPPLTKRAAEGGNSATGRRLVFRNV